MNNNYPVPTDVPKTEFAPKCVYTVTLKNKQLIATENITRALEVYDDASAFNEPVYMFKDTKLVRSKEPEQDLFNRRARMDSFLARFTELTGWSEPTTVSEDKRSFKDPVLASCWFMWEDCRQRDTMIDVNARQRVEGHFLALKVVLKKEKEDSKLFEIAG